MVTFCWRLERMGSVGGPSEVAPLVTYEAVADGDAWAPAAPCFSQVTLPSQVINPELRDNNMKCSICSLTVVSKTRMEEKQKLFVAVVW